MPFIAQQREIPESFTRGVTGLLTTSTQLQDLFRVSDVAATSLAETIRSYPAFKVTVPQFLNAVNTRFAVPEGYLSAARTLEAQLAAQHHETMALTFANLRRRRTVTLSQVIEAAQQAAVTIEEEGVKEEAEALREVADEAVEVIQTPTEENVAEMLQTLVGEVRSASRRLAALDERVEANERQRQADRREDQAFAIYLYFLSLIISVIVPLLIELLKATAGM